MAEIIRFDRQPYDTGHVAPETTLTNALGLCDDWSETVIIGKRTNGELYFASSSGYMPDILWLLEKMKWALLQRSVQS